MQKFRVSVKRVITDTYELTAMDIQEAYSLINNGIEELNDYDKLAHCYKRVDVELSDPVVSGIEFSVLDLETDK